MKKETVLYLSNESAQVVVGSDDQKDMIKINDFKTYPFAEGAMINGVITDESEIKSVLSTIVKEHGKSVKLVIDSGQILTKVVSVPNLKTKQMLQLVQDELSSVGENSEDLVYDYARLGDSSEGVNANVILCCAVERKLITSYIEIFKESGLEIKSIDFSLNVISKIAQELLPSNLGAYLLSIIDGNNLISVLFEDNQFKLSYRSRIISPRESEAFQQEIITNISNIYQFSKSGEKSKSLEKVYLCNLLESENDVIERITISLNVEAEVLPSSSSIYIVNAPNRNKFHLDQFILPVGSLFKR